MALALLLLRAEDDDPQDIRDSSKRYFKAGAERYLCGRRIARKSTVAQVRWRGALAGDALGGGASSLLPVVPNVAAIAALVLVHPVGVAQAQNVGNDGAVVRLKATADYLHVVGTAARTAHLRSPIALLFLAKQESHVLLTCGLFALAAAGVGS